MLKGRAADRHGFTIRLDRPIPVSARPRGSADRAHGRRTTRARGEHRRRTSSRRPSRSQPATDVPRPPDGPRRTATASPFSTPALDHGLDRRLAVRRPLPPAEPARARSTAAALLSVRFTQSMDREQTAAAFTVTANGKPVAGTTSWAEKAQVLRLPAVGAAPYGATVVMKVDGTARSRAGVPVEAATSTFRVVPKPAPAPKPKAGTGGSGSVKRTTHPPLGRQRRRRGQLARRRGLLPAADELHADRRLGDSRAARARRPGGRNVAPLVLSDEHLRARVPAVREAPRDERPVRPLHRRDPGRPALRHAGYSSYRWGENLGCRSGNPYSAVLGLAPVLPEREVVQRRPLPNLMNADYDRVGIGVWVSGGRVRLVIDFYHP